MFWCFCMSEYSSVHRSWEGLLQLLFCYPPMLSSSPVSPAYCTSPMPFSFRSPSSITTGLHIKQNSSCSFSPTISRLSLITSFWSRPPSGVDKLLAATASWVPTCAASWRCSLMWRWTSNKRRWQVMPGPSSCFSQSPWMICKPQLGTGWVF